QADEDGERDQDEGNEPRCATHEPPEVLGGLRGGHAAAPPRRRTRFLRTWEPTSSTSPLSCTRRPPPAASRARAPAGPRRNAALARVSASSVVGAQAVTDNRPVHAGMAVAGSSRWWA